MSEPRRILVRTEELINQYGWKQGDFGDKSGGFCILGALNYAGYELGSNPDDFWKARHSIICEIGGYGVAMWNDHPLRTKGEVLDAIKNAQRAV